MIKNKPFLTVLFCPPSPGSHLAKELRMIVKEETRRKGWTMQWTDRSARDATSIAQMLT